MQIKTGNKILLGCLILIFTSCMKPAEFKNVKSDFTGNSPVNVRVLIAENKKSVSITSASGFIAKDKISYIKKHPGDKILFLNSENITLPLDIVPENDFIKLNGIPYRGTLHIIKSGNLLMIVNHLSLEEYLLSVVGGEIPSSWPLESLKAQAVAARTFAYHHIMDLKNKNTSFDLKATTSSQLYKGVLSERKETSKAVKETDGIIMTYKDQPIISFFHSSCGGQTADYKTVWNIKNLDYLHQVNCEYCSPSPDYEWEASISMKEIKSKIRKLYRLDGKISGIAFERESGRISEVVIRHDKGVISLSGNKFRLLFEPKKIRSLNFVSKKTNTGIAIKGKGWGHGVGMCQWGAKGLSIAGKEYRNILKFYFKDIDFRNIHSGIASNR